METLEQIKNRAELAARGAKIDIVANPGPSGQSSLLIDNEHAVEVAKFLRDHPPLSFDFCSNVTGVDWLDRTVKKTTKVKQVVDGVEKEVDQTGEEKAGFLKPEQPSEFPVPEFGEHDLNPPANKDVYQPPKLERV